MYVLLLIIVTGIHSLLTIFNTNNT